MKKKLLHSFVLLGLLLSSLLYMQPTEVSAATARVDTKPENLVYNGEFALVNEPKNSYGSPLRQINISDSNGNLRIIDKNNTANGGHDDTAPLPGWNYYQSDDNKNANGCVLWMDADRKGSLLFEKVVLTTSEEESVLFSNAYLTGDYVYQNVAVEGNRKYNFSCIRCTYTLAGKSEKFDLTDVVLVELDSNKQVLRTTKTFPDNDYAVQYEEIPAALSTQFVTLENTSYVQIRLVGDNTFTTNTADVAIDSVYLAAVAQNTQVNYYAGNAANTANGSLAKTVTSDKKTYTLSALSDAEITAITPEYCTFSGWKCVENGRTYPAGTTMTLPAADSATMVAQWTKHEPVYTLTLDTHGVYPLLYSGVSSQNLAFTLSDENGKVTDNSILKNVTFTMELTDGFEKFKNTAGYAVVTLDGSKITAKKSGVVKIYAEYNGVKSTDYAVAVVPGDLNRSGSIDLDDAVQEAVLLRDATKISEFGTYGKELANMNNLTDGVDVDDIVKIVAMVRGISDYYN